MDLGTMKVKIENKGYTSHLDFATDMRLVFTNCYKYNPPDHEIGQAHHMFSRFLNLRILFTKFSLFCFPTRQKISIETKNADATFYDFRKRHFAVESFQDFLIQLDIKLPMHLLEMSIFSQNDDLVRLNKIMNNLVKDLKILRFKVVFWCL